MESFPSQSIQEKEQSLREEILNRIYIEKSYIFEFYSTNDLIRIMQYTDYNIDKINFLLESYTKEDLLKKIEEHLLLTQKQKQISNSSITQVKKVPKQKHILYSKFVSTINSKQKRNVMISAWNFLNNGANIIDLKDAIRSLDKMKIISKLKQQKSNKGVSINDVAFNREFFKKIEQKEKKYITYYQQCFEDNDINYLEHTDHFDEKMFHLIHKETSDTNTLKLFPKLLTMPTSLLNSILSYVDIFTIGRIALCSKSLYSLIYQHYSFDAFSSRCYVNAIFLHSKLYYINLLALKKQFKSNFDMLKRKNRIRYGGVYYCRVKYVKEGQIYGEEFNKTVLVQYYRALRFLPNGVVMIMTTPFFKANKIRNGIKNGSVEIRSGKYHIDELDRIQVKCDDDEYIYKFGWGEMIRYRSGYSKGDIGVIRGIELVEYNLNKPNYKMNVPLNDKFPVAFRFRAIEQLKHDISIKCIKEIEEDNTLTR